MEEELLLAARAKDVVASLFDAARWQLQRWDLSEDRIQQVIRAGQPIRSITVHAPMAGFVTERKVFPIRTRRSHSTATCRRLRT